MKRNKWIKVAVGTGAAFLAGLITGLSLSGRRQKKAGAEHIRDGVKAGEPDPVHQ